MIGQARTLLKAGHNVDHVRNVTGLTKAIIYQLKREIKPIHLGCIVCGSKASKGSYCRKHYNRYIEGPRRKKRILKGRS